MLANTAAPGDAFAPPPPPESGSFVNRSSDEHRGRDHRQHLHDVHDALEHQKSGMPGGRDVKNQKLLVSQMPTSTANTKPPTSGKRAVGEAVHAHRQHLRRERSVEHAAEDRVDEHPRVGGLEAEAPEALVGDRQRERERDGADEPVGVAQPRRRVARHVDLVEEASSEQHLHGREHHHRGGEPDLELDACR